MSEKSLHREMNHGPLAGYRIIELGTNFTAPIAAMSLGDQGADVIKVESPVGDQQRNASASREGVDGVSAGFLSVNRNKRSIMFDMKKPGATDAFRRIVKTSDVVMHNFRPGVMERHGLGYEELKKIKDDLIFVSISGFGEVGPYSKQRTYDPIVQGVSGMMNAQRDPDTNVPCLVRNAAADKITALVIFQAVTAALLARERTGKGQHVRVNMLNAVISYMWPDAMSNFTLLGDDVKLGGLYTEARLIYKTSDSYVVIFGGGDKDWAGLCRAVAREELITDSRFDKVGARVLNFKEVYKELENSFLGKTTAEWLIILREHDAVAGPLNSEADLHLDPQVVAAGLLVESTHPHAGPYRQPIHAAYFEGTPASLRRHAPLLGEQTDEILEEIGLSAAEIADLRNGQAIK